MRCNLHNVQGDIFSTNSSQKDTLIANKDASQQADKTGSNTDFTLRCLIENNSINSSEIIQIRVLGIRFETILQKGEIQSVVCFHNHSIPF